MFSTKHDRSFMPSYDWFYSLPFDYIYKASLTWSYLFLNYRIVIHNLRRTDAHEKAKFWLLLTFECASFELVR